MKYELAKQLKDAGFTFKKPLEGFEIAFPSLNNMVHAVGQHFCRFDDEWYLVPTLEELIEACGERFRELKTTDTKWWYASAGDYLQNSGVLGLREFNQGGSTPTEAVARLWLALNKK